jgi:hypothetical protein
MTNYQYRLFEKIVKTKYFINIGKNSDIIETLLKKGIDQDSFYRLSKAIKKGKCKNYFQLFKDYQDNDYKHSYFCGRIDLEILKNYYLENILYINWMNMHDFYYTLPEDFNDFYKWLKNEVITQYDK